MTARPCRQCGEPIVGRAGNARYCSDACSYTWHKAKNKARYAEDEAYRIKIRTQVRDASRFRNFGLSREVVDKIAESQGYSCAICGAHEDTLRDGLHLDHDHAAGDVRGLLCGLCNIGLGRFKDDRARLSMAILYLDRYLASLP